MGTWSGHWAPGLIWFSWGLWHLLCTLRAFTKAPKTFQSRSWHPARLPGILRCIELLVIIMVTGADIILELLVFPENFRLLGAKGEVTNHSVSLFEYSYVSFFFLLYALVALFGEATSKLPVSRGMEYVFWSLALSQEYVLAVTHQGEGGTVEAHWTGLLLYVITVIITCSVLEIFHQNSFNLALVRSFAMLLQGTWLWQLAHSIYGDAGNVPAGCMWAPMGDHSVIKCVDMKAMMRSKALGNLLLTVHAACVLTTTLVLYAIFSSFSPSLGIYDELDDSSAVGEDEPEGTKSQMKPLIEGNGWSHDLLDEEDDRVQADKKSTPYELKHITI